MTEIFLLLMGRYLLVIRILRGVLVICTLDSRVKN